MNSNVTAAELRAIPLFEGASDATLQRLATGCGELVSSAGQIIAMEGDRGSGMFVILEGTAIVTLNDGSHSEREVARLARGEFFGEMALLTGEARTANVSAADDLTVLVVHKSAMQAMFARRPGLARKVPCPADP